MQIVQLQLVVAIYRGKKKFLLKTPTRMFTAFGELLAAKDCNDDVMMQIFLFFFNQLYETNEK